LKLKPVGNLILKLRIKRYFEEFSCPDFARSGNIATEDVTLSAGPMEQFQHTMEPQLRKLGLHTSLKKGIVTLDTDFAVCKKGDKLNPEQARLLVNKIKFSSFVLVVILIFRFNA
jgi:mRNA turnover protein 4